MKPKHQRLVLILIAGLAAVAFVGLMLTKFEDNLVFFYSPSDIVEKKPAPGTPIRVGGLVEEGSVKKDGMHLSFTITDTKKNMLISYNGDIPSLFREGQGVVAEGTLQADGSFVASRILAKHDENYMPPEVAKSLKKQGHWKDDYK